MVKATYFCGYFLLICSAGTFGSAGFLIHKENVAKSQWPEATGHVKDCLVASVDPIIRIGGVGSGKSYAVLCGITYQLAGQTYSSTLSSNFTRSLHERSEIVDWIARSPECNVTIRIDPLYPYRFFVRSPLPFHHGENPEDYIWAAMVMGALGFIVTAIGRKLIRAGW